MEAERERKLTLAWVHQRVTDGELLLMDAGCELQGYASDITRAWPVNGTYSKPQRLVYDIVQDVHRQVPPGNLMHSPTYCK